MGRVRPPLMWDIKQNQLKRMRSTRNLNVHKTQQDIVRRAMAPLVAPAILASLARKSAKDLESALSALRGIQWDKHLKHIRSPKKEIARTLLRTSTTESTESERTVTTLSKADTIMMNARRKQSILLDLIIMLQSQLRLYITRKRYTSFRAAIVRMQRRFRQIPDDAVWTDDKPNPRVQLMYIVAIQREMRRFLARKAVDRRRKALTTIQSRVACYAARRRFAQQRASALLIQKHVKGRRDRFWYKVMKLLVSRLQARIRGYQVRKRVQIVLEQEMKLFRQEIFSLWQECHVQLSLRTKFWPLLMSGASFARIRTSETELRRLWHLLGIEVDGKGLSCYDETTAFAGAIGINVTTYCICQELSLFTKHDTPFETLRPALAMAYGFVEAERLQIYERLNSKAFEKDTDGIYRDFGIPSTEKKKKVAVARVICKCTS